MFDADGENALLDPVQTGRFEELAEVTLARSREVRLTLDMGIKLARRLPEDAEWSPAAGVIPHACRHDTVLAGDASHLTKSHDGVRHEVDDELCQRGVERSIFEGQVLRRSALHADPRVARLSCCNEGL